ncbi:MAG: rRNA biogenesis protein rrp5 [Clostridium sp.]|nr:rRNA biogenesis protein rrp5 [Clostridium sp.]
MNQSELLQNVIKCVENLAESLKTLATSMTLSDDFKQISPPLEEPVTEEKPNEKQVTLAEVRGLLAEISQSGCTADVKNLIAKYGGKKLSDIKEEHFNSLYKEAKELKNAAD